MCGPYSKRFQPSLRGVTAAVQAVRPGVGMKRSNEASALSTRVNIGGRGPSLPPSTVTTPAPCQHALGACLAWRCRLLCHVLHVLLSHARRHDHAVATVSMHGYAWVPCEAALCSHCPKTLSMPFSPSEHDSIKSTACNPFLDSLEWISLTADSFIRVPHVHYRPGALTPDTHNDFRQKHRHFAFRSSQSGASAD